MHSGRILGMEAQVCWNHPSAACCRRAVCPAAEITGAIIHLGRWVLDRACGK